MRLLLGGILLLAVGSAQAAAVTWTLDVTFGSGGTLTGTFDYDADTNVYSNVDIIDYGDYGGIVPINVYHLGDVIEPSSTNVAYLPYGDYPEGYRFLWLFFTSPLTNNGGEIALDTFSGFFTQSFDSPAQVYDPSFITSGSVTANVVPIPAAVWLFGSGLGLLGWLRHRRIA